MSSQNFGAVARTNRNIFWRTTYFSIAFFLFAVAAWRRFSLPQDPIADSDIGYLWPALMKLDGGSFGHLQGLNFLYPGMLYLILRISSDFRTITLVQHCLGLAAGILFLATWHRLGEFFPKPYLNRVWHEAIGLLGAGLYFLSNTPLIFEMQIRSDAVCMFFEILIFWLTVQFLYYRVISPKADKAFTYGSAVAMAAALLASLKPSFTLTALFVVTPVIWLIVATKGHVAQKVGFFGVAVTFLAALTFTDHYLGRNDYAGRIFVPTTLFAIHAQIIHAQMVADLKTGETGGYSREWLQVACDDLGVALGRAHDLYPDVFPILGFKSDYLITGPDSLLLRWQRQLGGEQFITFLRYWYWHSLVERPRAFAEKILRQIGVFYSKNCPAFKTVKRYSLSSSQAYGRSLKAISWRQSLQLLGGTSAGTAYLKRTQALCFSDVVVRQNRFGEKGHLWCAQSYLVVLMMSMPVVVWFLCSRTGETRLKWGGLLVLLFYSANFGNVLAISVVHSMEVERYSSVLFITALFAELWAIRWLIEIASMPIRKVSQTGSAKRSFEGI